jgi:uncharacterized protein YwqG
MNFFKKLFNQSKEKQVPKISDKEFFEMPEIKGLIQKYRKKTTLLKPHKSKEKIKTSESKFGGTPNFTGFNEYPCCDSCNSPLNFVLQLYKKDYSEFYFPEDKGLFQLFRCPNNDCPDSYSENYDLKMFHFYFDNYLDYEKVLLKPAQIISEFEPEIPDCSLRPIEKEDFPNYDDFNGDDFNEIENVFGEKMSELFMEKYTAIPNSKINGYPSFTQSPYYPICECGMTKDFFFQLSSEDIENGVEYPPPPDKWSSHGIMIGDVGNIYYYVCKSCGPNTIESNWDCF